MQLLMFASTSVYLYGPLGRGLVPHAFVQLPPLMWLLWDVCIFAWYCLRALCPPSCAFDLFVVVACLLFVAPATILVVEKVSFYCEGSFFHFLLLLYVVRCCCSLL